MDAIAPLDGTIAYRGGAAAVCGFSCRFVSLSERKRQRNDAATPWSRNGALGAPFAYQQDEKSRAAQRACTHVRRASSGVIAAPARPDPPVPEHFSARRGVH
jgi:hypothetical protein